MITYNYLNTSFFNLINSKRIELAKNHLATNNINLGIEEIGYEVGFNSKTAFYRAFNKFVNKSPSAYLKSIEE
ncbi:MAG: AraC family transcriptional regulator [Chlorobi bacterium]|nr:AraC family transcriptional regulator [Chlorobiota bacterium]